MQTPLSKELLQNPNVLPNLMSEKCVPIYFGTNFYIIINFPILCSFYL